MAISASLVLPGVPPVRSSADDRRGCVSHREFRRRRLSKVSAKITLSQKPQRYFRRIEVIHAGIQVREIASHDIQFDFVESSGAGRGAKVDFSTRICTLFGNPCREIEEARQILNARTESARDEGTGSEIAESAATPVCATSRGSGRGSIFG